MVPCETTGCQSCSKSSAVCEKCAVGRFLLNNSCLETCPKGFFGVAETGRCIDAASIPDGKGPDSQGLIVPCQDKACVSCKTNFAKCDACDGSLSPKRYVWNGRCITLDEAPAGVGLAKDEDKLVDCKITACRGDDPAPVDGEIPDRVEPPKPLSDDLRKVTSTISKFKFEFSIYQEAQMQDVKLSWTAPTTTQSIALQVVNSQYRSANFDERVQNLASQNVKVQDESLHTITEFVRAESNNVKTVLYYYLSTRFRNTIDLNTASKLYDEVKVCKNPWIVKELNVAPYVDAAEKYILGRVQFLIINCVPKKAASIFVHTATGRALFSGQAPSPSSTLAVSAAGVVRELLYREVAKYFA